MSRSICLAVCLVALASTEGARALSPTDPTEANAAATASASVARIYVNSGSKIVAYSAASNGKLTAVPGSPFNLSTSVMAANGNYLFGFEPNSVIIDSLSMASNGALKKATTTNPQAFTGCPIITTGQGMRVDHSGEYLYNGTNSTGPGADGWCTLTFQTFKVQSNGELTFLSADGDIGYGGTSLLLGTNAQLGILGNNKFAYYPYCNDIEGSGPNPGVYAFERLSNGELADTPDEGDFNAALPEAPNDNYNPDGGDSGYYCPIAIATDPTDHYAMTMYAQDYVRDGDTVQAYGPVVIGSFTANSKGDLTTTSTSKNMPTLPVSSNWDNKCLACAALRMSPSGKVLAAGGSAGLFLFHFNGASPVTKYKALLAGEDISSILWDDSNHMYVLGSDAKGGKLWVYTVTTTSVTEASGSPYTIASPGNMYVHSVE